MLHARTARRLLPVVAALPVVALVSCATDRQAKAPQPAAPTTSAASAAPAAAPTTAPPAASAPTDTPVPAPTDESVPTGAGTADVTRSYAEQYVLTGTPSPAAPAAVPGVDAADPLAVAAAYVAVSETYDAADPAGVTAAFTAPGLTTPAFAARSVPDVGALARLATAQERSTVKVGTPVVESEAPVTADTTYVEVPYTATVAWTGGGGTSAETLSLRLVLTNGAWMVDAVLADSSDG